VIGGKQISLKIGSFICDAPARAFMAGVKGTNSFDGCMKCTQVGKRINNVTVYSASVGSPRTDENFRNRTYLSHHSHYFKDRPLLLEKLNIDIISAFPLDPMHLIDLGVVKNILDLFVNSTKLSFRIKREQFYKISEQLIGFSKYMPLEFVRKPRGLDVLPRWKAVEFRMFILCLGQIVLKNIVSGDCYYHFLLLMCAYRLLLSNKYVKHLDVASDLIQHFVLQFCNVYPQKTLTYNVHNMLHLVQCVKDVGHNSSLTAYKFENFLQKVKRSVRKPVMILQQID